MPERAEAAFYEAMSLDPGDAQKAELEKVAHGPAIDLVEVRMAQDLLSLAAGVPGPTFPADVELPELVHGSAF